MNKVRAALLGFGLLAISSVCLAAMELYDFSSEDLRARFQSLTAELRCPKCLNQNLADSDSPISADLRREIHAMLEAGHSDRAITDFLVERYGVFILYDPPKEGATLWVWFIPIPFALFGLWLVLGAVRAAASRPIDDEDPDR